MAVEAINIIDAAAGKGIKITGYIDDKDEKRIVNPYLVAEIVNKGRTMTAQAFDAKYPLEQAIRTPTIRN